MILRKKYKSMRRKMRKIENTRKLIINNIDLKSDKSNKKNAENKYIQVTDAEVEKAKKANKVDNKKR